MDPKPMDLMQLFAADAAEAIGRRRDDTNLATARQRDATQLDNRALQGFIWAELFRSDDPAQFAGLNAGVRTPTTLDLPSVPVSNPMNTGGLQK